MMHELCKPFACVARWALSLENELTALRLEAVNPSHKRRRLVEEGCGLAKPSNENNRQTGLAGTGEHFPAIFNRRLNVWNRHQTWSGEILFLHVYEDNDWHTPRGCEGAQIDYVIHPT